MDMFIPIYQDLFDFQEESKEMYRSLMEDITTIEHHQNVLNTLKQFGYSKPLIESVGGETFIDSLHILPHEMEGWDPLTKKSVCMANLIGWIKDKLNYAFEKILQFIKFLLDKIAEWFFRPNPNQKATVSRLTMINTFPAGMQVPNVFNYQEFITRLTSLRNLITYIGGWITTLGTAYKDIKASPHLAASIVDGKFKDFRTAVDTFTKEISHNHYRDGVIATPNECKVIVPTTSPDPVDPVEFGWNGGSQIRYAGSLVSAVMDEVTEIYTELQNLYKLVAKLKGTYQSSNIEIPLNVLLNITGYVLNTSANLFNGIREFYAKFYSMTEWIIQEIQKKK